MGTCKCFASENYVVSFQPALMPYSVRPDQLLLKTGKGASASGADKRFRRICFECGPIGIDRPVEAPVTRPQFKYLLNLGEFF